ncbi:MAG: S41 family peptidase, partial [Pyrinomonadaceae bacterium]
MTSKSFGLIAAASVVIAAALVGGIAGSPARQFFASGEKSEAAGRIEQAYTEALSVVEANYVDEVEYEKAGQSSIQGMLSALDPHSNFFTRAEYQKLLQDQDSRFIGIGVNILRHRDGVYVQSPVEGTPAARAGLRFGDRIVEVDGKDAREWTTPQVSNAVRGPRGERVTIKIERAGESAPLYFQIVRDSVPLPSIRSAYMVSPTTGYVALTGGFTHTTAEELQESIGKLREQGMRQLVLDLRNNPGGLLEQSISVASQFVGRGQKVVSVRGREGDEPKVYKNVSTDPVEFPLVVLINRNSASASEIVAGALQDHRRALVMGERSFGKGSVQTVLQTSPSTALRLTTARYYTPSGKSIQAKGISPDIEVLQDVPDELKARTDTKGESSLRGHLKA